MEHADIAYKAHMAAMALSARAQKDDDCGCGCEGAGTCKDTWRRLRHVNRIFPGSESAYIGPIKGRQDIVDTKAALHSRWTGGNPIEHEYFVVRSKAGLVRSSTRTGQALQAIASIAIPGDMSDIRSPIRSTVYETLTPGGGGGRRGRLASIGGTSRQARRCPPGFEHGGRFANRTFSNCGNQLFDLAEEAVETLTGGATSKRRNAQQGATSASVVRDVEAGPYAGSSVAIRRAARIPKYVKSNKSKFADSVDSSTAIAGAADGKFLRIVRRDGVILSPVSSIKNLARQRNNPDMTGSAAIVSVTNANSIGGEEISLLGSGITEIHYVMPGGGKLILKSKKGFTPKKAGSLRRNVTAANKRNDAPGSGLSEGVQKYKELSLSAQFDHIDDPNEMVVIERAGQRRTVQKWAFYTWYATNAPGRPKTQKPWKEVQDATEE